MVEAFWQLRIHKSSSGPEARRTRLDLKRSLKMSASSDAFVSNLGAGHVRLRTTTISAHTQPSIHQRNPFCLYITALSFLLYFIIAILIPLLYKAHPQVRSVFHFLFFFQYTYISFILQSSICLHPYFHNRLHAQSINQPRRSHAP